MMYVRLYSPDDAKQLVFNAVDKAANMDGWEQWAVINGNSGPAYTGLVGDKIVCAAGIRIVREGVGHLWSVFSSDIGQNKLSVFRGVKSMLEILIKEFNFTRLRTESRIGFPESQRLLEHLGFKQGRIIMNKTHYSYFRSI